MPDRQLQIVPIDDGLATKDAPYLLQQLEVFNWGPFCGLHRAVFDSRGTAIIGPTGSGKTTLVDALMTLLVAQPRYNLASTHETIALDFVRSRRPWRRWFGRSRGGCPAR